MIIFPDKSFMTSSLFPDSDWTGEAKYVVPDGSTLASKVLAAYPYYAFVENETGRLIDIEEEDAPEPEPLPAPLPSPQEDTDAMLVDHELRITLLELEV